jgi:methionyl-tRNA formyltransferase
VALRAILAAGPTVPLVLTQPDRPHGRGLKPHASPVKAVALEHGLTVQQPPTLRTPEVQAALRAVDLDVLVVAAYGLILPPTVLAWPRHGCLNIHASRLPRWRGAAPIARAIEAGDPMTGVSIMRMDAGLDTGPVIETVDVPVGAHDTAGTLHDTLAAVGARAMVDVLARLARDGALAAAPQRAEGATYAAKIAREEGALDWSRDAAVLERRIRAFTPTPGAFTTHQGRIVKVTAAALVPDAEAGEPGEPGEVVTVAAGHVDVACSGGVLRLLGVTPAGGRAMAAGAFARGHGVTPGTRLGR